MMKKICGIVLLVLLLVPMVSCDLLKMTEAQVAKLTTQEAQGEVLVAAIADVPVPPVDYFQERRTIAKWTERWDAPNIPTYVYLISYGNIIGYYVADGKPASTKSYLIPEDTYDYKGGRYHLRTAPDIDGTYGDNNPGIRFFTAEGTAVEWGGSGASYLYSDVPLPLNVPKLNGK